MLTSNGDHASRALNHTARANARHPLKKRQLSPIEWLPKGARLTQSRRGVLPFRRRSCRSRRGRGGC
jgi:hypothetical protein